MTVHHTSHLTKYGLAVGAVLSHFSLVDASGQQGPAIASSGRAPLKRSVRDGHTLDRVSSLHHWPQAAFRECLKEARIAVSFLLGITSLSAIPGFSELDYSIRNLRRF